MPSPCTISHTGGVSIVAFAPETMLDASTVEMIQSQVYELVETVKAPAILLDMEHVSFVSSQGLGFLLSLRVKAARSGAELALAGLRAALFDLFKVTQLDQLYTFYPSRAAALETLKA